MFDVEAGINDWRVQIARERTLTDDSIAELEDHLRSAYRSHVAGGMLPQEAFRLARESLGTAEVIATEFRKVEGTGWRNLVRLGWVAFVVAFLLPVHEAGITLTDLDLREGLLPGVQAFLVALLDGDLPITTVSALTNFLMLATVWSLRSSSRKLTLLFAAGMFAATLTNAWWMTSMDTITELRAGYFAWCSSFAVVGTGLAMRARYLARPPVREVTA